MNIVFVSLAVSLASVYYAHSRSPTIITRVAAPRGFRRPSLIILQFAIGRPHPWSLDFMLLIGGIHVRPP